MSGDGFGRGVEDAAGQGQGRLDDLARQLQRAARAVEGELAVHGGKPASRAR